jgi:hypothetical protein
MGILGVALDGFSLVNLVRGPQLVSTFHLEEPGRAAASGPRKSKPGATFTASPAGIGVSF